MIIMHDIKVVSGLGDTNILVPEKQDYGLQLKEE